MKTPWIFAVSLLAMTTACSDGYRSHMKTSGTDFESGTQTDLMGEWSHSCQTGSLSTVGFAALSQTAAPSFAAPSDSGDMGSGAAENDQDQNQSKKQDQSLPTTTTTTTTTSTTSTSTSTSTSTTTTAITLAPASGAIGSLQSQISISQGAMTLHTRGYSSSDCTGSALIESQVEMKYSIPNYQPGTISNLDALVTSANMTLTTDAAVEVANANALCGFHDWQTQQPKDIAGTSCHAAGLNQPIYEIVNYQNGNLFFGVLEPVQSRASNAARPTTLIRSPLRLNSPSSPRNILMKIVPASDRRSSP